MFIQTKLDFPSSLFHKGDEEYKILKWDRIIFQVMNLRQKNTKDKLETSLIFKSDGGALIYKG